jgi:hypothetical protein
MYAVVQMVSISEYEQARKLLHDEVLPTVQAIPGFVTGHWLAPVDGTGMSVVVFETEAEAHALADQMAPGRQINDYVTVQSVEVREVAGSVHQIDDVPIQVTPEQ